ncbi:helix-hairpin-helix domain-containing protein [Streptomyces sp. NPDC097619]|uniref:helix-hairpin-helix domain-containing protein n=1 Tax=Streptomyces sp. NPDC097619 TaxID=3157228 RepID=UPI0033240980
MSTERAEHTEGAEPGTGTPPPPAAEEPTTAPDPAAEADEAEAAARAEDGGTDGGAGTEAEAGALDGDGAPEGNPEASVVTPSEATEATEGAAETVSEDTGADAADDATEATEGAEGAAAETGADGAAPARSEAEAELAAQRVERERIARRKAERGAPVEAGAKLSGTAADLLAAVRAVEGGAKPSLPSFDGREAPAPRRAPEPPAPRRPVPAPTPAPTPAATPAPDLITAVREVLTAGGAPAELAGPAATTLGEGAPGVLRQDPWRLLELPGVKPSHADGFARALLGDACGPGDERRAVALVGWLLAQAALKGHTALDAPVLTDALGRYGLPDAAAALEQAVADGAVLVFQEPLDEAPGARSEQPAGTEEQDGADEEAERPVRVLVGLEGHALAEESLADGLARLLNTFDPPSDGADWEAAAAAAPGPSAAALIRAAAGHGLVAHTGGEAARAEPAALVAAALGLGLRAWVAAHAPDGRDRAAALLPAGTGAAAVTVSGLLAGTEGPGRDADGALDLDLLVVLDAPQLDVDTAAALVESVPDGARLVLGGDPGGLGSAGPGRVFADLLAARVCPQVASRTPDPGPLGELVSGIGVGELGRPEAPGKEVVIVPVRDAGEAVHRTVQLLADSVPRAFGIDPDHTQVITPGHGGAAGTRALNAALKERLNPGPGRFGGFDPGDRVVYVPAPGRSLPGRVRSADAAGLHLDCADGPVTVAPDRVERTVRHGWAVTAHQAVGVRWPAVVAVLPGDAVEALSRDWVYTAFGRAERHLSVVQGVDQALPRAVAEVPAKARTTRLTALLRGLAADARD